MFRAYDKFLSAGRCRGYLYIDSLTTWFVLRRVVGLVFPQSLRKRRFTRTRFLRAYYVDSPQKGV